MITQQEAILAYLKTHRLFIPAFMANSWIKIGEQRVWLGSEIGKRARELYKAKQLEKDWVYKKNMAGVLKAYKAYYKIKTKK